MPDVVAAEAAAGTPRWATGKTVAMAVGCVLVTPFGLLALSGYLLPIGLVFAVTALALASFVLARTTAGRWPRRFAWALVGYSLLPWVLTAAYLVQINLLGG